MSTLDPATISALSALAGSAIGALASVTTTWLTQHHQDHTQRRNQEASRRERLFGEFIDQASKTYADGMVQERLDDPAKLVPMYATIEQASPLCHASHDPCCRGSAGRHHRDIRGASVCSESRTIRHGAARDILHEFAEACRAELTDLR